MSQLFQTGHPDVDQLSAFQENALPFHEREAVLGHLATCAECRELVVLSLPQVEAPPLVPERKRWFAGLRLLWPAAALATAAMLLVYAHRVAVSGRGPDTTNQVAQAHPPPFPEKPANAPEMRVSPPIAAPKPVSPSLRKKQPANQLAQGSVSEMASEQPLAMPSASGMSLGEAARPSAAPTASAGPMASSTSQAQGTVMGGLGTNSGAPIQLHGNALSSANGTVLGIGRGAPQALAAAPAAPTPKPAAPAPKPAPPIDQTAISADAVSSLALVRDIASDEIIPPHLPSGAAVLSTAVRGRQMVAIDAKNTVFLSNDDGVHWVAVTVPWKGRAVRAGLVSSSAAPRVMARTQAQAASQNVITAAEAGTNSPLEGYTMNSLPSAAPALAAKSAPSASPEAPGSLGGIVTDPTGAAISDATITVKGPEGQVLRSVRTDREGRYVAGGLAPGAYDLEASARGFQTDALRAVPVDGARQRVENLTLQVGAATQSVMVTSAPPVVELESAPTLKVGANRLDQSQLFAITTDTGERWTSSDGVTWRHQ